MKISISIIVFTLILISIFGVVSATPVNIPTLLYNTSSTSFNKHILLTNGSRIIINFSNAKTILYINPAFNATNLSYIPNYPAWINISIYNATSTTLFSAPNHKVIFVLNTTITSNNSKLVEDIEAVSTYKCNGYIEEPFILSSSWQKINHYSYGNVSTSNSCNTYFFLYSEGKSIVIALAENLTFFGQSSISSTALTTPITTIAQGNISNALLYLIIVILIIVIILYVIKKNHENKKSKR